MCEGDLMSSYQHELVNGKPALVRAWKNCNNVSSCTAFTLVWNFISWGSVLMADGGKISVNGTHYHSFSEAYAAHPITAAMFLFPLIGLVMLYHTVAIWVNKTQMQIDAGEFIIRQGPLFWMPSEFKIPVSDIKQAYVQEYSAYVENKQPIIRYRLMVQRFSSGDAQIESGITEYSDALILEKWLEENIGIQNVSVPGEVGFKKAS
jgi:hypothetical protein